MIINYVQVSIQLPTLVTERLYIGTTHAKDWQIRIKGNGDLLATNY
jgi:hypothetical protein